MNKFKNVLFVIVLIFLNQFNLVSLKNSNNVNLSGRSLSTSKNLASKLRLKTIGGGFGFTGICSTTIIENLVSNNLPTFAKNMYSDIIYPIQNSILNNPQFCMGDFTGNTIKTQIDFDNAECNKIPLNSESTYGVVSMAAFNVKCGDETVKVSSCMIFDNEGTGAVSINGNLIGCGISLTGLGSIFQPFLKYVGAIGYGVSLTKKFEKNIYACFNNSGSIACEDKIAKAHFLFSMNLALPNFKIGNKNTKDYMKLSGTISYLIDLGNLSSITGLASTLFNTTNTCEIQSSLIRTIRNLGVEYTMTINGNLTLLLAKHTNDFLPDLDFELYSKDIIITTGSGSTGLKAGIYFNLKKLSQSEIINTIFTKLMERFSTFFDITLPSIQKSYDSDLALFVDTTMFGIKITLSSDANLECYYKFADEIGSCRLNTSYFTADLETAKWVIKRATNLFENKGATIAEISSNTIDFAKDASKAVSDWAQNKVKYITREATLISTLYFEAGEKKAKETLDSLISTGSIINNSINEVKTMTTNYINKATSGVIGIAGTALTEIKDVTGEAADFAESVAGAAYKAISSATNSTINFFKSWAKKKNKFRKNKLEM